MDQGRGVLGQKLVESGGVCGVVQDGGCTAGDEGSEHGGKMCRIASETAVYRPLGSLHPLTLLQLHSATTWSSSLSLLLLLRILIHLLTR
jgi:hypothetical protein